MADESSSEKVISEEIKEVIRFFGEFPKTHQVGPEFAEREEYWTNVSRILLKALKDGDLEVDMFNNLMGNVAAAKEWLSERDMLTKLGNRRAYDRALFERMSESARHKFPLSILLLDLDNFKAVNDTLGHTEGDKFLIKIADILRENKRPEDLDVRFGGDELGMIVPYSTEAEAEIVKSRLEAKINEFINGDERFLELKRMGKPLGASFGVAQWNGEETPESLFKRADANLYENKIKNKNPLNQKNE